MFTKKLFFCFFLLFFTHQALAIPNERITLFNSDITVNIDGSMTIIEKITVNSTGDQIKHGLYRTLPGKFAIQEALINNAPTPYTIEASGNRKTIYIADFNKRLAPGSYTFLLKYTTPRQLKFLHSREKLYWNITGSEWLLHIEHVMATIRLPKKLTDTPDKISLYGYTGYKGEKEQAYTSEITKDGTVIFQTTNMLRQKEGLTIVITWPRGVITRPTFTESLRSFLIDNTLNLILILILFLLLVFYFLAYINSKKNYTFNPSTSSPLFEPPHISAGAVYYLKNGKNGHRGFTAEIIDMARAGYLSIDYKEKILSSKYTLLNTLDKNKKPSPTNNPRLHKELHERLFSHKDLIELNFWNKRYIKNVYFYLSNQLETTFADSSIKHLNTQFLLANGGALACSIYLIIQLMQDDGFGFCFLFFIAWFFLFAHCKKYFKIYTHEGKQLIEQIDRFKMYLEAPPTNHSDHTNPPPEKTPELYEKFLPYAIALDVEKEWGEQFKSIFTNTNDKKNRLFPTWYTSNSFETFYPDTFAYHLGARFHRSTSPHYRSGGGGGSSGGGGGGGGGGGC